MQYFELGSPGGLPFSLLSFKASGQNWLIPVGSPLEAAVQFAAEVFFFDGVALVVFFLAFGKGDDKLGVAVLCDVQFDGDYCVAFEFDFLAKMAEFAFGKKEFAVPNGLVLAPGTPEVLGNVHALYKQLAAGIKIAESIHQRGLSGPDGLDFRSNQLDSGREGLKELVVEAGATVAYLYFTLRFHGTAKIGFLKE